MEASSKFNGSAGLLVIAPEDTPEDEIYMVARPQEAHAP